MPRACPLRPRPSAANSRRHRPPEWPPIVARPALRSSRKASPTADLRAEDMMELGLTRAPLRRGFHVEPSDGFPPISELQIGSLPGTGGARFFAVLWV